MFEILKRVDFQCKHNWILEKVKIKINEKLPTLECQVDEWYQMSKGKDLGK